MRSEIVIANIHPENYSNRNVIKTSSSLLKEYRVKLVIFLLI